MQDLARRLNFFSVGFVGVLGLSLATEIIHEDDFSDKIDDFVLLILGAVAIYWYKKFGFKTTKTSTSIIFLTLALLTKLGAIVIEHADAEAVGDDIGIFLSLILALAFVVWQSLKLRRT